MTYEQLAEHAVALERSAIVMDMRQRGYGYDNGRLFGPEVNDAMAITTARFSGVAEMFHPFLGMPDPAAFDDPSRQIADVAGILNYQQASIPGDAATILANPVLGRIDDVKQLVHNWYGQAALAFKDDFLGSFHPITSNQFALVIALRGAIEAERAMWRAARLSVDDVAHKAHAALDAMLDCDSKPTSFLLTVAGSIFAIGAALTTGGASIALTVVGEVAASAGAVPRKDPETLPLAGRNAAAIIEETRHALSALTRQILDTENTIRDAMDEAMALIGTSRSSFVAPRPSLADATRATVRDGVAGLGDPVG